MSAQPGAGGSPTSPAGGTHGAGSVARLHGGTTPQATVSAAASRTTTRRVSFFMQPTMSAHRAYVKEAL